MLSWTSSPRRYPLHDVAAGSPDGRPGRRAVAWAAAGRGVFRCLVVGAVVLMSATTARAQAYYLESDAAGNREVPADVARLVAEAGVDGRVLRLYVPDVGWRYVFRSEEEADDVLLGAVLDAVALRAPLPLKLVVVDDGHAEVARTAAAPAPSAAPSGGPLPPDRAMASEDVVQQLLRAHGGPSATAGIPGAATLLFRFERVLPGLRVAHVYARRGDDRYLEIRVLEGEGVSSRTGVVNGRAWSDAGGDTTLDPLHVRNVIERFAPERVLGLAASLTTGALKGRAYEHLALGDSVRVAGRGAVVLQWPGDLELGPRSLVVDVGTGRLVEAASTQGPVVLLWSYSDYADAGLGWIYPRRAEATQGDDLVDAVEVSELDVEPVFPSEWFPGSGR